MRQLLTTSVLSLSIEFPYSVESSVKEKIKNCSSVFQIPFSKYVHIDKTDSQSSGSLDRLDNILNAFKLFCPSTTVSYCVLFLSIPSQLAFYHSLPLSVLSAN